jgi:cytochrome bd-type quinol oxidase subunit 1
LKQKAILGGVIATVVFIAIIVGLYLLGGDDQSALERLRDIAVIFVVLLSLITVILLAAITAALVFLAMQIKDRVIPLLEEATGTVKRVRGTTNFMTEEAVKPIINIAGQYSRLRTMTKTVTGQRKKPPKPPTYGIREDEVPR